MPRIPIVHVIPAVLAACTLAACTGSTEADRGRDRAVDSYERASSLAAAGDLPGSFDALTASLQAGYRTPSNVLRSPDLRALVDAPPWRPRVRELLRASARESSIALVRADEAGEPMVLTVRIVAGHGEPPEAVTPRVPAAGVVVGFVQVDAAGYYQPWADGQDWNPRHFGFAVTDETGTVVVHTVRPGHYAPEYEMPAEPAHVHYDVERDGVLLRASEFYFEDDPRLAGAARPEAEQRGVPIASIIRDARGVWRAEVTIPVRGVP